MVEIWMFHSRERVGIGIDIRDFVDCVISICPHQHWIFPGAQCPSTLILSQTRVHFIITVVGGLGVATIFTPNKTF